MRDGKRISLIIPTKNEAGNLQRVLDTIPKYIDEIIVIDAYSKDGTIEIARKNNCKIFFDNHGKGSAVLVGVKKATGDFVIMMDADCSNRAVEFGLLIEGLEAGYDFCFGSRFIQGGGSDDMPWYRRIGNKFFVLLVNTFWGTKYSDLCYGYRSFRRNAFGKLDLKSRDFSIETEMSIHAAKKKMRVIEIPSFEKARHSGRGNLRTFRDGYRIIKKIVKEIFTK